MENENPYAAPQSNVVADEIAPEEGVLADRGARFGAAIIDNIIMMVVTIPLMFALGTFALAAEGKEVPFMTTLIATAAGAVAFVLFHAYLISKTGQTIGKKVMGIAMVSAETDQLLPAGKLIGLRYFPLWIISVIPIVGQILPLIDVLFIFRSDRRCLHDFIAGTKVVRVTKKA